MDYFRKYLKTMPDTAQDQRAHDEGYVISQPGVKMNAATVDEHCEWLKFCEAFPIHTLKIPCKSEI